MGKNKKAPEELKAYGFTAHFYTDGQNLGGAIEDDEWSRDSTRTSWSFERLSPNNEHPCVTIDKELFEKNEEFWYVFAIHSGGDSFGHDEGAYKTDVGLYADRALADKVARAIREHADAYCRYHRGYNPKERAPKGWDAYSLKLPDGQTICASWNGYFESLDYVEVVSVDLKNGQYPNRY